MLDGYDDDDVTVNLVERRFFAALAAANTLQGECEILREVMDLAEEAWRAARAQFAELEALRDALGKQFAELTRYDHPAEQAYQGMVLSAA
jgi:hypothetical protein